MTRLMTDKRNCEKLEMTSVEKLMIARKENGVVNVVIQETYDNIDECHKIEDKRYDKVDDSQKRDKKRHVTKFMSERTRDIHV